MIRYPALLFLLLGNIIAISPSAMAQEKAYLTQAVITALRNRVHLQPKNQAIRQAQMRDRMLPGDALATARASLAELRFNDGTLARMGEKAVFRFVPKQRSFQLSRGTVLLLIPPRQGRTRVLTPNVQTGIRGSALFVRYNKETNTTLVGALTNSGIEVTTGEGSPVQVLEAGQMAVIVDDRIEELHEFDLQTFYDTSSLVEGLDLGIEREVTPSNPVALQAGEDTSLDAVRQEILEGLASQSRFNAPAGGEASPIAFHSPVVSNPRFIRLPLTEAEIAAQLGERVSGLAVVSGGTGSELEEAVSLESAGSFRGTLWGLMPDEERLGNLTGSDVLSLPAVTGGSPSAPSPVSSPISPAVTPTVLDLPSDPLPPDPVVVETPTVPNMVIDVPTMTDNPIVDSPIADSPIIDNPIGDGPAVIESPAVDPPLSDGLDNPITDNPVFDSPIQDDPPVDLPSIDDLPTGQGVELPPDTDDLADIPADLAEPIDSAGDSAGDVVDLPLEPEIVEPEPTTDLSETVAPPVDLADGLINQDAGMPDDVMSDSPMQGENMSNNSGGNEAPVPPTIDTLPGPAGVPAAQDTATDTMP